MSRATRDTADSPLDWNAVPMRKFDERYQNFDVNTPSDIRRSATKAVTLASQSREDQGDSPFSSWRPSNEGEARQDFSTQDDANEELVAKPRASAAQPPTARQHLLARVGLRTYLLVIPSILFAIASMSFLSWLWFGDRLDKRWRRLMLAGWSAQAVTISALILRTSLSILAGIVTSMVASIALEHGDLSLQDTLRLSVARFVGPGPDLYWYDILFRRKFMCLSLRALLLILLLTSVAIQFASTILLSDLGNSRVVGFHEHGRSASGFSWDKADYRHPQGTRNNLTWFSDFLNELAPFHWPQQYWSGQPGAFQPFAEYTEPGVRGKTFDDTGLTLRMFLPFGNETVRNNIRSFKGLAPVLDTRVVCMRPELIAANVDGPKRTTNITIRMPPVPSIRGLLVGIEPTDVFIPSITGPGWIIYPLEASVGGMLSSLDVPAPENLNLTYKRYDLNDQMRWPYRFQGKVNPSGAWRHQHGGNDCGVDIGNAYLILNNTALGVDILGQLISSSPLSEGQHQGPWMRIVTSPKTEEGQEYLSKQADFTVCFDSLPKSAHYHQIQDFGVEVSGSGERVEPLMRFVADGNKFDISHVLHQLVGQNSSAIPASERALRLEPSSANAIREELASYAEKWSDYCTLATKIEDDNARLDWVFGSSFRQWNPNVYNRSTYPWIKEMALNLREEIVMCTGRCITRIDAVRASSGLTAIFDSVIKETNSPALAMQALLTQMLRETYYNWLPMFDHFADNEIVGSDVVLIPTRTRGFYGVLGIVVAHLTFCGVACVAFGTMTGTSRLNDGGQAVADIIDHPDARRIMNKAGELNDEQLEALLKGSGIVRKRRIVFK